MGALSSSGLGTTEPEMRSSGPLSSGGVPVTSRGLLTLAGTELGEAPPDAGEGRAGDATGSDARDG